MKKSFITLLQFVVIMSCLLLSSVMAANETITEENTIVQNK